ncbi:PhzF family phenazine biosynthesis protein [Staphylococcus hyicus]|uniref:PhzF family phenazine biosynthesis protein n=1 Tax=Staphylococcus hyicus TaxID=1284 RepID=UPI00208F38E5|nr:PhzF family phenazine biosynthesis protein [Staphylococcus hyicus]MCO4328644.1 PhzF family phenazine biosynthesis protein [Staphylococcus hyicus]MCO4330627.1 PhzF family phenazine biosynthesis protein [Staphylococcus hyicus]MCO4333025.1 PhzF family phenazine biosynthesis protein [Staphylococcus hyicus]MCO4337201.1 PhzF family phenazine biosynthesis protein [Staphylococcus hyicus]
MKTVKVYQYDVFTTEPTRGNAAGVVLNGDMITTDEMQAIAYEAGYNETAFLMASAHADFQIRFFTPQKEVDVCGHATIATVVAAKSKQLIPNDKSHIVVETKVGSLNMTLKQKGEHWCVTMTQNAPQFKAFEGSVNQLVHALGIHEEDIDDRFPMVYGNTGVWTLLVPVTSLDVCRKMKPHNQKFAEILTEEPGASVHPFCLETYNPSRDMHGRHFSASDAGTIEDAVTGTASGVMGAYYAKYINPNHEAYSLHIEQGQEMGKDGFVEVDVYCDAEQWTVYITGQAIEARQFSIVL